VEFAVGARGARCGEAGRARGEAEFERLWADPAKLLEKTGSSKGEERDHGGCLPDAREAESMEAGWSK
jgi:hypothetical protein